MLNLSPIGTGYAGWPGHPNAGAIRPHFDMVRAKLSGAKTVSRRDMRFFGGCSRHVQLPKSLDCMKIK